MCAKKKLCIFAIFSLWFAYPAKAKAIKKGVRHVTSTTKVPVIKKATVLPQKAVQPAERTILVKNEIEKKMTGYKYIFKTYYPSSFTISINGKEIEQGKDLKVPIKNNKLFVRYAYDFRPYKRGTKEVEFTIEPTTQDVAITFSWKDDWRVIASNATPVAVKEITA